jgi:uncharacterized protein with HEPN domain
MPLERRDAGSLWDMQDYALLAQRLAGDKSVDELLEREGEILGLYHAIQTIGEAARRVSSGLRQAHPEIQWSDIIAMRNVLVHQYEDVSAQTVWDVVHYRIPVLLAAITRILGAGGEERPSP